MTDDYAALLVKRRNDCRGSGHREMGASDGDCVRCANIENVLKGNLRDPETGRVERIGA